MPQYLLSTYSTEDQAGGPPPTPEQMEAAMAGINALETDMRETGTFVFSGRLTGADEATVFTPSGDDVLVTDGPFPEAKEQIAGFYIISADDDAAARDWARRVAETIGRPIESRPISHMATE